MSISRASEMERLTAVFVISLNVMRLMGFSSPDKNGKHFDARFYGSPDKKMELANKAETDAVLSRLEGQDFRVTEVKTGSRQKKPVAPFTTSTILQG